jgi:hypothetical protein
MKKMRLVNGISVDPVIPNKFLSSIPIKDRSEDHLKWLEKSFILTVANPHFPGGNRYDVYCLEAEDTSDSPALWGMFGTLKEAVQRAIEGPPWRKQVSRSREESSEEVCKDSDSQISPGNRMAC